MFQGVSQKNMAGNVLHFGPVLVTHARSEDPREFAAQGPLRVVLGTTFDDVPQVVHLEALLNLHVPPGEASSRVSAQQATRINCLDETMRSIRFHGASGAPVAWTANGSRAG